MRAATNATADTAREIMTRRRLSALSDEASMMLTLGRGGWTTRRTELCESRGGTLGRADAVHRGGLKRS
jgi:hypothetical protein